MDGIRRQISDLHLKDVSVLDAIWRLDAIINEGKKRGIPPPFPMIDLTLDDFINPKNYRYKKKSPGAGKANFTKKVIGLHEEHPSWSCRKIARELYSVPEFTANLRKKAAERGEKLDQHEIIRQLEIRVVKALQRNTPHEQD